MCVCVCGCVCGCVFLSIFVHVYIFMPVPSVFVAMLSQQTLKLPGCMLCGRTEASNAETELQESTDQLRFQLTGEMHTSYLSTRKGSNTTLPITDRYLSPVCVQAPGAHHSAVMRHFEENSILPDNQYGFRRGRSCETQLLDVVKELTTNLESGKQTSLSGTLVRRSTK